MGLLTRDGKDASLRQAGASEVSEAIVQGFGPARHLYQTRMDSVSRCLATCPAWSLNLSSDPANVDQFIDEMLNTLDT